MSFLLMYSITCYELAVTYYRFPHWLYFTVYSTFEDLIHQKFIIRIDLYLNKKIVINNNQAVKQNAE